MDGDDSGKIAWDKLAGRVQVGDAGADVLRDRMGDVVDGGGGESLGYPSGQYCSHARLHTSTTTLLISISTLLYTSWNSGAAGLELRSSRLHENMYNGS